MSASNFDQILKWLQQPAPTVHPAPTIHPAPTVRSATNAHPASTIQTASNEQPVTNGHPLERQYSNESVGVPGNPIASQIYGMYPATTTIPVAPFPCSSQSPHDPGYTDEAANVLISSPTSSVQIPSAKPTMVQASNIQLPSPQPTIAQAQNSCVVFGGAQGPIQPPALEAPLTAQALAQTNTRKTGLYHHQDYIQVASSSYPSISEGTGAHHAASAGTIRARRKANRVKLACVKCRRRKIKCTGEFPCRSCLHLKHPCTYKAVTPEENAVLREKKRQAREKKKRAAAAEAQAVAQAVAQASGQAPMLASGESSAMGAMLPVFLHSHTSDASQVAVSASSSQSSVTYSSEGGVSPRRHRRSFSAEASEPGQPQFPQTGEPGEWMRCTGPVGLPSQPQSQLQSQLRPQFLAQTQSMAQLVSQPAAHPAPQAVSFPVSQPVATPTPSSTILDPALGTSQAPTAVQLGTWFDQQAYEREAAWDSGFSHPGANSMGRSRSWDLAYTVTLTSPTLTHRSLDRSLSLETHRSLGSDIVMAAAQPCREADSMRSSFQDMHIAGSLETLLTGSATYAHNAAPLGNDAAGGVMYQPAYVPFAAVQASSTSKRCSYKEMVLDNEQQAAQLHPQQPKDGA